MAGGPEDIIEKSVVGMSSKRGWSSRKVSWIGRRGAQDRLFMRPGAAVWIEFKKRGERPTEQQERQREEMQAAGLRCYWTDSIEGGMAILREYES